MLQPALRWTKAGLRRLPLTRAGYRALKAYALCRGPYRGTPAELEQRLNVLLRDVGPDRLPLWTRLPLLATWLDDLNRTAGGGRPARPRRILFVTALPYWVQFCLPVAVVLAGRGDRVDFVWSPYLGMDQTEASRPPFPLSSGRWDRLVPFVRLHPNLSVANLEHLAPGRPTAEMHALAERYSTLDCQHWLRRERIDFESNAHARELKALRLRRNLECATRLDALLRRRRYDSLLIPNGAVYEFGMAYHVGRGHGVRCVTLDFSERKGAIVTSRNIPAIEYDSDALWQADAPHVLTPEREQRLREFLQAREWSSWKAGQYIWPGQPVSVQPEDRLRAELGLSPQRRTALLCTNLAYDAAVLGHAGVFPTMAEWVLETIRWFVRCPGWQLVVRCHPAEAHCDPGEPVPDLIARHFPDLPDHIRVIKPADPVNTYGLIRFTDLGLVYTTTTGLEMATRGIPVIVAGQVHYAGRGFTTDPANRAEYAAALERVTTAPARLSACQVELALCYADLFFQRLPRPFPWWNVGQVEKDVAEWPVRRILTGDCPPEFLETFDELACR
jgi:hypothetical protein